MVEKGADGEIFYRLEHGTCPGVVFVVTLWHLPIYLGLCGVTTKPRRDVARAMKLTSVFATDIKVNRENAII